MHSSTLTRPLLYALVVVLVVHRLIVVVMVVHRLRISCCNCELQLSGVSVAGSPLATAASCPELPRPPHTSRFW